MDVDYTMDEPDEDTIAREELELEIRGRGESLIVDDSLPEVSPSAILAQDIIRVNGWHRNDDALDEENEAEVHETLQAIRGTQLMEYMKETALGQEQDHQKLLAAIRKVEEVELQENDAATPETDNENDNEGTRERRKKSRFPTICKTIILQAGKEQRSEQLTGKTIPYDKNRACPPSPPIKEYLLTT